MNNNATHFASPRNGTFRINIICSILHMNRETLLYIPYIFICCNTITLNTFHYIASFYMNTIIHQDLHNAQVLEMEPKITLLKDKLLATAIHF